MQMQSLIKLHNRLAANNSSTHLRRSKQLLQRNVCLPGNPFIQCISPGLRLSISAYAKAIASNANANAVSGANPGQSIRATNTCLSSSPCSLSPSLPSVSILNSPVSYCTTQLKNNRLSLSLVSSYSHPIHTLPGIDTHAHPLPTPTKARVDPQAGGVEPFFF